MNDTLFDEWRAYEKLLDNDYMHHRRFFRRLAAEIDSRFQRPLSILDLGCGDVSPIHRLLQSADIRHYCGVDESQTALAMTRHALSSLGINFTLHAGDLQEVLPQLQAPYDVIVASFSLHHLAAAQAKLQVLRECRRLLNPEGFLAVIDVFLAEKQSRDEYLRDWGTIARQTFTALDASEMSTLLAHAGDCDFPESEAVYKELARQAGYAGVSCQEQDDSGSYRMLILESH